METKKVKKQVMTRLRHALAGLPTIVLLPFTAGQLRAAETALPAELLSYGDIILSYMNVILPGHVRGRRATPWEGRALKQWGLRV